MKKSILLSLTVVFFTGCSSMEQSALVYTSTMNVGVGVDVQGTGLDVTLGYETNDLAYVPVAVSEKGSETDDKKIAQGQDTWEIISAHSNNEKTMEQDNIDDPGNQIEEKLANNQVAKNLLEDQDKLLAEIRSLYEGTQVEGASKEQIAMTEKQITAKRLELKKLQAVAQSINPNANLRDAYSVYGSFDAESDGSNSGATSKVGRFFSTGVAAQKLARAVQISAESSLSYAVVTCIQELHKVLSSQSATEDKIPHDIYKICTPERVTEIASNQ
ncbi:hypothetical protein [Vibrio cyclitrophicus]|uniref:hypothetical protein n=1 Tax=Vibrio cyclitrophicus TaxID=47951 RepID=UPI000C821B4C|nr:hypothetical protein [Vibrio cyclitrophicus]PMJ73430.1 hypothetical protein BCU15_04560 [Vibrio cyclitrophicus]